MRRAKNVIRLLRRKNNRGRVRETKNCTLTKANNEAGLYTVVVLLGGFFTSYEGRRMSGTHHANSANRYNLLSIGKSRFAYFASGGGDEGPML